MSKNNNYKINNVSVTTNGRNELYFDVEWDGKDSSDCIELRLWEDGKEYCLEVCAYPSPNQRIVVKDFAFRKNWDNKKINKQTIYVELGVAEYSQDDNLEKWDSLADYEPIELNIYYESHLFRKNVIELR